MAIETINIDELTIEEAEVLGFKPWLLSPTSVIYLIPSELVHCIPIGTKLIDTLGAEIIYDGYKGWDRIFYGCVPFGVRISKSRELEKRKKVYGEEKKVYGEDEKKEFITSKLSKRTLIEQAAEECGELIQALLKYIRASKMSDSPTPVSEEEAMNNIIEEFTDVMLSMELLGFDKIDKAIRDKKLERTFKRLKEDEEE